jgi:nucleotide-binding universal stress UspA family protein
MEAVRSPSLPSQLWNVGAAVKPNPIRSVLAATDLTPASDDVLGSAARLARASGARLHVIHAFDLELSAYPDIDGSAPTFQGRIAEAEERLGRQLERTLPEGMQASSREIVIYVAHRAIVDYAAQVQADVIVLGPHRSPGAGVLGTTADRVIRTAPCPCLVVRRPLELPLWRVLVPMDLSAPALGALDMALGWVDALGAGTAELPISTVELDVVHVIPRFVQSRALAASHATIGPRLSEQVEKVVAKHGGVNVREELLWGDGAAGEIVRYAEQQAAGLIVLGTHGHGALKRALIGGVASAVVRMAPCPVLLVPPARWRAVYRKPARGAASLAV